ncbi:FHA domain-containing protein [Streptomyces sp. NPDC058470]|uniref:FHA domain-containing protein n=1 Tax=Streptomyces sp. NPDC058470 TaxID=3346515 RepID=UPI003667CFAF
MGRFGDIRLTAPDVSKPHAELRQGSDGVWLNDLASSNGVLRNGVPHSGVRIEPGRPVRLSEGDQLRFGSMWLTFRNPADEPDTRLIPQTGAPGPRPPAQPQPQRLHRHRRPRLPQPQPQPQPSRRRRRPPRRRAAEQVHAGAGQPASGSAAQPDRRTQSAGLPDGGSRQRDRRTRRRHRTHPVRLAVPVKPSLLL